jgi:apolipoprotein N-acyltransferase
MRSIPWRLLALAALTAILLDLPFPLAGPLPAWRAVFAWFALVPLILGVLGLPRVYVGHRRRWIFGWSFLGGWLSGTLWFGANCYWVYDTMHLYGGLNEPLAVLSLVLFSLYLGFWFGAFALTLALVRYATEAKGRGRLALAAVPFLWTAMEYALAQIPAFPWDLLGYSQVDNGLLTRIAPWAGVYGISFVLAVGNALLAAGVIYRRQSWVVDRPPAIQIALSGRAWGAYGVVLVLLGCAGLKDKPPEPPTQASAVLVQPNLDVATDNVWTGPDWERHITEFQRLSRETCKGGEILGVPETGAPVAADCNSGLPLSLVVWPESPAPFRDSDLRFQSSMASIAQADKAPMVVGTVGLDLDRESQQYKVYNSASVLAQDGRIVGRYDKIHLVPFGEYIPAKQLFFFLHKVTESMPDMSTGTLRKTFRLSGNGVDGQRPDAHRYGVFICYESVFGDEVRQFVRLGAEVLVNISDDGWYGDTSAPWQHLNMARMRAIENRRWILRDTNNGVTASIDPYGTVRQSIPRHQVDALAAKFGYSSELTFYTVHGDWFAMVCAVVAVAFLVWVTRVLIRG